LHASIHTYLTSLPPAKRWLSSCDTCFPKAKLPPTCCSLPWKECDLAGDAFAGDLETSVESDLAAPPKPGVKLARRWWNTAGCRGSDLACVGELRRVCWRCALVDATDAEDGERGRLAADKGLCAVCVCVCLSVCSAFACMDLCTCAFMNVYVHVCMLRAFRAAFNVPCARKRY
jgi:hypothetical protein